MNPETHAPLVSVAAVCYNHARFLESTLDSIKAQTYPHVQLVIMDDCSRDNSVELIEKWIARNQVQCTFIAHQSNRGLCRTLNEALGHCTGKYLQLISCDDLLVPDKLKTHVELLEKSDESAALVFSDAFLIGDEGAELPGRFIERHSRFSVPPQGNIFEALLEGNFIPAMTVLLKRDIFEDVGYFDEQLAYEDHDMWLRIARKYQFLFSDTVSAYYRIHDQNLHKSIKNWNRENYWMYKKHLPHPKARAKVYRILLNLLLRHFRDPKTKAVWKDFFKVKVAKVKVAKVKGAKVKGAKVKG